jgi:ubiquinone/menaquinone biosynthesis C-methylase UbiE
MADNKRKDEHRQYQRQFFDKNVHFFTRPIPEDVEERTALIVEAADLNAGSHILDVGTGTGYLLKFFLQAGVKPGNIVACDLSEQMMAEAKIRYAGITFFLGCVTELPPSFDQFDAIFFNACFANLFDPKGTLGHVRQYLKPGGRIIISQPVGRQFVEQLHHYEPQLVPHHLPTGDELNAWCEDFELKVSQFHDAGKFYLAVVSEA